MKAKWKRIVPGVYELGKVKVWTHDTEGICQVRIGNQLITYHAYLRDAKADAVRLQELIEEITCIG